MFKNFLKRFALLGIAFLIACIFQTGACRAYLVLDLLWTAVKVIGLMLVIILGGILFEEEEAAGLTNILVVIIVAGLVGINLLLSWGISRIFGIDFYTSYVVLDFILCLIPSEKSEQNR